MSFQSPVGVTVGRDTGVVCGGVTDQLLVSATSDRVANPQVAIIVVRTDNFRVGTSEDRVTVVVGASVQIVTKEDL